MFKALYKKIAKKNRGFTLIELIVVIAIIGILIAILVPSMIGFINSAKETAVKAEAKTVFTATQAYITNRVLVQNETNNLDGPDDNWQDILSGAQLIETNKLTTGADITDLDIGADGVTITNFVYEADDITVTFPDGTVSR